MSEDRLFYCYTPEEWMEQHTAPLTMRERFNSALDHIDHTRNREAEIQRIRERFAALKASVRAKA